MKNPIIAALDVDSENECWQLIEKLKGHVGGFKLGPRLVVRYGQALIERVAAQGLVFLDLKFLDIPNTMESAVRAGFAAGASWVTVHAWAGPEALSRLARVEAELSQQRDFRVVVVTILTSFAPKTLPPPLNQFGVESQVRDLAGMAYNCGLRSFVCSPLELSDLRTRHADAFLVAPGIRLADASADDQKRVLDPASAMRAGADALVIGRPLLQSAEPARTAQEILRTLPK